MPEELAAQRERHRRPKRPQGNKHEIPGTGTWRGARLRERRICDFRARRIRTPVTLVTKDGGMIRDSFPGINSPGQAPVEHAPGLSGSRIRLQWSFSGARTRLQWRRGAVGGGGVVEPWASSDFLGENPGEFSSPSQNSGSHLPGILGIPGFLHAGAPITTREKEGSQSRDSAACED
jgi:hypothetical protein